VLCALAAGFAGAAAAAGAGEPRVAEKPPGLKLGPAGVAEDAEEDDDDAAGVLNFDCAVLPFVLLLLLTLLALALLAPPPPLSRAWMARHVSSSAVWKATADFA
jgi:hypothetical protein